MSSVKPARAARCLSGSRRSARNCASNPTTVGLSGDVGKLLSDMATAFLDVTVLDAEELERELATLAAHLYAGTCRWLELVAELDRRGGWAVQGARSCAHWLAWRCGLAPRAAREHVRVARRLAE